MQPSLSIVIPTFNCAPIIGRVLEAVFADTAVEKEVIVVDDRSTDGTLSLARRFPCRVIALEEKAGPSEARNIGARAARADTLMFLDSDALIAPGTLKTVMQLMDEHPEAACVSGVFEKNPQHESLFGKYRDLQLHYWHQTSTGEASVFILTAGAIRKKVFFEIGGFTAAFGEFADVEDYEIGHRIAARYRMITDLRIRFHHLEHASPFPVLVKKLFRRARMWVPLFLRRRQFEKNYATGNRALAALCAGFAPLCLLAGLLVPAAVPAAALLFVLFYLLDFGFYRFLLREGGPGFLLFSAAVHLFLSIVLFTGAVAGGLGTVLAFLCVPKEK